MQKQKRAYPTAGMSTCKRKHKNIVNEVQAQDEDQNQFKMSVGMKITSSADNTSNEYLTTMTVKDIRECLNKIPETGFGVMCG